MNSEKRQTELTYKDAGVDRSVSEAAKGSIKDLARATYSDNVLKGIGLFSGFYQLDLQPYKQPILVSSIDGVGTKVKIAEMVGVFDSIGVDLVNHSVNDIMVCGADPLFFLDYLAADKLEVHVIENVIQGISEACQVAGCALLGGETAEMPGVYERGNFDVAGAIVGIIDKPDIIDGSDIAAGDVLVGVASNGLHTNGYSLVRKVFFEHQHYSVSQSFADLEFDLGHELLRPHRSYANLIKKCRNLSGLTGIAHITGGGIVDNTCRLLSDQLKLNIDWHSWQRPEIFNLIQQTGNVPESDMRETFNLGVGLILICRPDSVDEIFKMSRETMDQCYIIGSITSAE